jgi:hypothetical protein
LNYPENQSQVSKLELLQSSFLMVEKESLKLSPSILVRVPNGAQDQELHRTCNNCGGIPRVEATAAAAQAFSRLCLLNSQLGGENNFLFCHEPAPILPSLTKTPVLLFERLTQTFLAFFLSKLEETL